MADAEEPAVEAVTWGQEEWEPHERAIFLWVQTVLGADGITPFWRDRTRPASLKAPYIELALGDEVSIGHDDREYIEREDNGKIGMVISGNREVTLSAKIRTRDQGVYRSMRRYLGKLKQSLVHRGYVGMLSDGGLGIVEAMSVKVIPSNDGTRVESLGLFEVRFSLEHRFTDDTADDLLESVDQIEVGVKVDGAAEDVIPLDDIVTVVIDPLPPE